MSASAYRSDLDREAITVCWQVCECTSECVFASIRPMEVTFVE